MPISHLPHSATAIGPTPIPNLPSPACPCADPIDRINEAATQRYLDAVNTGYALGPAMETTIVVAPIGSTETFLVRLLGEADALTISAHPVEAAGWLLRHVRHYASNVILNVCVPDGAESPPSVNVGQTADVAEFLMEDDQMEKPFALQSTSSSAFNGRQIAR